MLNTVFSWYFLDFVLYYQTKTVLLCLGHFGQILSSSDNILLAWQKMKTSATLLLACSMLVSPVSTLWSQFITSVISHGW